MLQRHANTRQRRYPSFERQLPAQEDPENCAGTDSRLNDLHATAVMPVTDGLTGVGRVVTPESEAIPEVSMSAVSRRQMETDSTSRQILVFKIFGWYLHILVALGLYIYNRSPSLALSQKSAM